MGLAVRAAMFVLLVILISCLVNFSCFTSCIATNSTTIIAVEPEAERQYFNYFRHAESPFKDYLSSPRKIYVISKAAEFAVNHDENGRFVLRGILSIQNRRDNFYKLRTLLLDKRTTKLKEKAFEVFIAERQDGRYVVQTNAVKDKRSSLDTCNQNDTCDKLSTLANCSSCGYNGICHKGASHVSPWLSFALKTQRALQVNVSFIKVQMLGAHNAFNDRADGYGIADDCLWPPPYKTECIDLANQEFSFTDQLNMGIRAIEIDPWWCFGKIRMSHAHNYAYLGCGPWDREFKDGIQEIAEWKKRPENRHEIIRLYLEDGESHTRGHDDLVNGPIGEHFGDMVLTPRDLEEHFGGKWPTPFQMQQLGKTVVISAGNAYNHQGKFIHKGYWHEITINKFKSYRNSTGCEAMTHVNDPVRVYSDSTKYGPFWNGPSRTGTVMNYMDYMKCGVVYPAADQVNPQLIETAVFTWAENEPRVRLSRDTCVIISAKDKRWYVEKCEALKAFACRNKINQWIVSTEIAPYSNAMCPEGSQFSIPHNAYEHQQLSNKLIDQDTWVNFTSYATWLVGH